MARTRVETIIAAPAERCFDAARDVTLHTESLSHTGERAVAGRTSGLLELGESVTWEARHLGVRQRFTARITAFDRPRHFRDEMVRGVFRSFVHDHHFVETAGGTRMVDLVEFRSPWGALGRLVDRWFLRAYVERLLTARAAALERALESRRSSS